MEVEATAFMEDDNVRRKVSPSFLVILFLHVLGDCSLIDDPCVLQMTKFKAEFDKVRKQIRKLQREADKRNVSSGADTLVS